MRTFFGIELNNSIRDNLQAFINKISYKHEKDIKWVKKDNLHLTLQFVGEIDEDKVTNLKSLASDINFTEFRIDISKLGAFPYLGRPRVIWIGVNEGTGKLEKLQKEIEEASLKVGGKKEDKPYHPHITLARVKGGLSSDYLDSLKKNKDIEFGAQTVKDFSLFSSQLTSKGPIYKIIKKFESS